MPVGVLGAPLTGSVLAHVGSHDQLPPLTPARLLTEWEPTTPGRSATIAAASYLAYAALIGDRD